MITWHQHLTTSQADHRLVGQQYLLHQHLLVGITTTTITEVVLRTGTYAFLEVALLETTYEGSTHHR